MSALYRCPVCGKGYTSKADAELCHGRPAGELSGLPRFTQGGRSYDQMQRAVLGVGQTYGGFTNEGAGRVSVQ